MAKEIKTEMKERILHTEWMNNRTKELMIIKIDHLMVQIGYPKWYNNQTALMGPYDGVGDSMYIIGAIILRKHIML